MVGSQDLTEESLARVMNEIRALSEGVPIAFHPNAVRYWVGEGGKLEWSLIEAEDMWVSSR